MKFQSSSFAETWARACQRKGGEDSIERLLPVLVPVNVLAKASDARCLAKMSKCVFNAGFNWSVIEKKWPGFEEAFLEFDPGALHFQPDEFWDALTSDTRIVRHGAKIQSVRRNAAFVLDIAKEHGGFGKFLANWPGHNIIGLWEVFSKQGNRLGGNTGRYFLRFMGKDCFLPNTDVVLALRMAGMDLPDKPTSKRDLRAIQDQFNLWYEETGLPLTHISRICALSAGSNTDAETLAAYMNSGR